MKPYLKIIAKNTFTLFNFVNVVLAVMVALVGSYKNMLFIFIALANTMISIVNGIRAQRIVDKMRLLSEQRPVVMRDGKPVQVKPEEVIAGDVTVVSLGDQVMYDGVVREGMVEVNEAFITGEQDNIAKRPGDKLTSGSFVVSGTAKASVEHVGADNFVTRLQREAGTIKTADAKLFRLMNNIVKYISWTLVPIGALLLWARFRTEPDTTTAVTSTVAALINMIPEGLILLTSSVLALATIRLSRQKVLVQDLYSIETLARVDCICLDKTGTLTTGRMTVHDAMLPGGGAVNFQKPESAAEKRFLRALTAILSHQMSENATTSALKEKLARGGKIAVTGDLTEVAEVIPFSSDRKYSGVRTAKASYLMGAVEFITKDKGIIREVKGCTGDYRVIAVVKKGVDARNRDTDARDELLGVVRLSDEIRADAREIIQYFYDNEIEMKVISGDDLSTVEAIAREVGVQEVAAVDLSAVKPKNYAKLVREYNIFTRVTPAEKKQLVKALKKQGRTVAMTGDGVNDILAMKEADCSIAIGEGSDAARRSSKLVLLGSDFAAVPSIIAEGRQSINNLERSTSLFLAKTVYASVLAVLFTVLPLSYPFSPIEMSLLNFACIGFPGLILALESNTARIKNQFARNILTYSVPIGLTVSVAMLALSITAEAMEFSRPELTTASVFITFVIDITLIYWISRPLNKLRATLLTVIVGIFAIIYTVPFFRNFFEFTYLPGAAIVATLIIAVGALVVFTLLRYVISKQLRKKQ